MALILVVDDDPGVVVSVCAILHSRGHETVAVSDGEQALAALGAGNFDLVVTDVWMPGLDGVEILKKLRRSHPGLPVIVLTGGSPGAPLAYGASLAAAFGATAILYKPFEKEDLIAAMERSLPPVTDQ